MQTLHQATAAKVMEGATKGKEQVITLPAGTRYQTVALTFDPLGYTVKRISCNGFQYEILE